MRRDQLVHLARAAARIAASDDVVVIGSQALHALDQPVPIELLVGEQADLFVADRVELGDRLEAALGPDSMYHDEHGTCLRAVGPLTPVAPAGWLERLVPLHDAAGAPVAHCMDPHDLVLAKLVVGRGKDLDFALAVVDAGIADPAVLDARSEGLPLELDRQQELRDRLVRLTAH